jgi:HAD superfamily hydrolase (TIGR01662 family)
VNLTALLAAHPHVLLDFDGPVCAVFGGVSARHTAQQLADALTTRGVSLPDDVADTDDPFDVLRAAGEAAPTAEALLRDLELQAVEVAPLTPGVREALAALHRAGHSITIVSNNSEAAVRAVLTEHQLAPPIGDIIARTDPDPALLKPHPHLLLRAASRLHTVPSVCVLVGDSTTDVTAARAAGTAVIAYANKPEKRASLAAEQPDAIIDSITDLTDALAGDTLTIGREPLH